MSAWRTSRQLLGIKADRWPISSIFRCRVLWSNEKHGDGKRWPHPEANKRGTAAEKKTPCRVFMGARIVSAASSIFPSYIYVNANMINMRSSERIASRAVSRQRNGADGGLRGDLRQESNNSISSRPRSRTRLVAPPRMASARARLVFCSSSTFSSTVSRAISR